MTARAETIARLSDLSEAAPRKTAKLARRILAGDAWSHSDYRKAFRAHFKKSIRKRRYINFRESFDDALDYLELLELSIQTGFLPLEAVRPTATREMRLLLGLEPAQLYLEHYDFLLVRFLAARLDLPLKPRRLAPPAPNPDAEVRFAVFLATHREWTSDSNIERFTRLLDNYLFGDRLNSDFFSDYLLKRRKRSLSKREEVHIRQLSDGLDRFVQLLGGLFAQLSDSERPRFGSFYAYWLAKFFGYELESDGYERIWHSWESDAIKLYSPAVAPDRESLSILRSQRLLQLRAMRDTWRVTRKFLEET